MVATKFAMSVVGKLEASFGKTCISEHMQTPRPHGKRLRGPHCNTQEAAKKAPIAPAVAAKITVNNVFNRSRLILPFENES